MIKLLKKNMFLFVSFAGGALLTLGFNPYNQDWVAFISPLILLYTTEGLKPKAAGLQGFLFGLGFYGFGVYWVYHSIFHYGQTTATLAYAITGLFIFVLALFMWLTMYTTNKIIHSKPMLRATIVFPIIWVLFELIRSHFLTGFPWLIIGMTQTTNASLKAFAPVGGIWLVSWLTLISAGLIYGFIVYFNQHRQAPKQLYRLAGIFLAIWVIGAVLYQQKWTQEIEETQLSVALVQGNVPQKMRWDPNEVKNIMQTYEDLLNEVIVQYDFVIWPEGAIPLPLPYSKDYFDRMNRMTLENNTALIAGVPIAAEGQESYYNAIIGLGNAKGIYYKERLVPFGEFVPFEKLLRGLIGFFDLPMSSFISRDNPERTLSALGLNFAPAICYEIAFPLTVRENVKNADFIVTVSNDAWFGKTIGPEQHVELALWRAIETGRYVLRATNTGVTAIIDPKGKIKRVPEFEKTILTGIVSPVKGQTPWVKFGLAPVLLLMLLTLMVPFYKGFMGSCVNSYKQCKQKAIKWYNNRFNSDDFDF